MNGVLSKTSLIRQDAAIGIGRSQTLGVRWRRSTNPDGSNPQVFSFSGYSGELRISSDSGEEWLTKSLAFDSDTGVVSADIAPGDTSQPVWLSRTTGRWAMVAKSGTGAVTVVASGIIRITQEGF